MVDPIYKRMAARLGGLRQTKLPTEEVREAGKVAKRVVEVLRDESRPRKDALGDMKSLVISLASVARELDVLQVYFRNQDELMDVATAQFQESGELLDVANKKLKEADHESRHIETYIQNLDMYAAAIITSQEFQAALVGMADDDYQVVEAAFKQIRKARAQHARTQNQKSL